MNISCYVTERMNHWKGMLGIEKVFIKRKLTSRKQDSFKKRENTSQFFLFINITSFYKLQ